MAAPGSFVNDTPTHPLTRHETTAPVPPRQPLTSHDAPRWQAPGVSGCYPHEERKRRGSLTLLTSTAPELYAGGITAVGTQRAHSAERERG
jgi:hypothetical protein